MSICWWVSRTEAVSVLVGHHDSSRARSCRLKCATLCKPSVAELNEGVHDKVKDGGAPELLAEDVIKTWDVNGLELQLIRGNTHSDRCIAHLLHSQANMLRCKRVVGW